METQQHGFACHKYRVLFRFTHTRTLWRWVHLHSDSSITAVVSVGYGCQDNHTCIPFVSLCLYFFSFFNIKLSLSWLPLLSLFTMVLYLVNSLILTAPAGYTTATEELLFVLLKLRCRLQYLHPVCVPCVYHSFYPF